MFCVNCKNAELAGGKLNTRLLSELITHPDFAELLFGCLDAIPMVWGRGARNPAA